MRLYLQYSITFLIGFFVIRLFFQASAQESAVEIPKAILLARLSEGEPIPAQFQKEKILKAILTESERLIDRKPGAKGR
jgi:hypothetical protein